jgi:hypothetical protein
MTDFASYSELQTAIGTNWLNRTDLDDRIPAFIAMAEEDIRADLKQAVIREALVLDSNAVALPAACGELRSVRYNDSSRQYSVNMTSESNLAALRRTGSGTPAWGAVVDNTLLLDVDPDTDYTAEIVYFEELVPLSDDAPTNSVLEDFPSIYLYGALIHSAPYLEHDERLTTWVSMYDRAVQKANKRREDSEFGSAPMSAGLPVVF